MVGHGGQHGVRKLLSKRHEESSRWNLGNQECLLGREFTSETSGSKPDYDSLGGCVQEPAL